jgi:hypothetical protein
MFRPRLVTFAFDGAPPEDTPLDIAAVRPDAVCVLDSWFTLVVHTGSHVAGWIKQVRAVPAWAGPKRGWLGPPPPPSTHTHTQHPRTASRKR